MRFGQHSFQKQTSKRSGKTILSLLLAVLIGIFAIDIPEIAPVETAQAGVISDYVSTGTVKVFSWGSYVKTLGSDELYEKTTSYYDDNSIQFKIENAVVINGTPKYDLVITYWDAAKLQDNKVRLGTKNGKFYFSIHKNAITDRAYTTVIIQAYTHVNGNTLGQPITSDLKLGLKHNDLDKSEGFIYEGMSFHKYKESDPSTHKPNCYAVVKGKVNTEKSSWNGISGFVVHGEDNGNNSTQGDQNNVETFFTLPSSGLYLTYLLGSGSTNTGRGSNLLGLSSTSMDVTPASTGNAPRVYIDPNDVKLKKGSWTVCPTYIQNDYYSLPTAFEWRVDSIDMYNKYSTADGESYPEQNEDGTVKSGTYASSPTLVYEPANSPVPSHPSYYTGYSSVYDVPLKSSTAIKRWTHDEESTRTWSWREDGERYEDSVTLYKPVLTQWGSANQTGSMMQYTDDEYDIEMEKDSGSRKYYCPNTSTYSVYTARNKAKATGEYAVGSPNLSVNISSSADEDTVICFTLHCWNAVGDDYAYIYISRDPVVNIIYYPNNTSPAPAGTGTKWVSPDYPEGTTVTIKRTSDFSPAYSWSSQERDFLGWNTSSTMYDKENTNSYGPNYRGGGTHYASGQSVRLDNDLILYAMWTEPPEVLDYGGMNNNGNRPHPDINGRYASIPLQNSGLNRKTEMRFRALLHSDNCPWKRFPLTF